MRAQAIPLTITRLVRCIPGLHCVAVPTPNTAATVVLLLLFHRSPVIQMRNFWSRATFPYPIEVTDMPYHSNFERTALSSQRIVFKVMLIVHKSFNNIAPIYISEMLKVYTPSRNLHSSNMSLRKKPTSKRTWGDRFFSVVAPRLWNHLPTKLKSCHSITRFKSLLKTHLMSQFVIALYMYLGT